MTDSSLMDLDVRPTGSDAAASFQPPEHDTPWPARAAAVADVSESAAGLSVVAPEELAPNFLRTAAAFGRVASPLVAVDAAVIVSALAVAAAVVGPATPTMGSTLPVSAALLVTLLLARAFEGLYPGVGLNVVVELRKQSTATCCVFAIVAITSLALGKLDVWAAVDQAVAFVLCLVGLPLARRGAQGVLSKTRWWGFPMLVFGCGPEAQRILVEMRRDPSRGLRPIGCVGSHETCNTGGVPARFRRGRFEDAPRVIEQFGVQWVVAAMPGRPQGEISKLLSTHAAAAPHRLLTTGIADFPYLWQVVRDCGGQAGIEVRDGLLLSSRRAAKRTFDVVAVMLGGLAIVPLLAAIVVAIKLTSPGPVFFGQRRLGRRGREFTAWKFRSMVVDADAVLDTYLENHPELRAEWERTHKLKNDPRVTPIGRWLRKTSLDELPQIWNVLVGEMSLVGPRPIIDSPSYDRAYVHDFPEAYALYYRVRPGITGLWQVAGRNRGDYELRPQLDGYYVRNWSAWLDIYLLARTIRTVCFCEGAY